MPMHVCEQLERDIALYTAGKDSSQLLRNAIKKAAEEALAHLIKAAARLHGGTSALYALEKDKYFNGPNYTGHCVNTY